MVGLRGSIHISLRDCLLNARKQFKICDSFQES
jgi:hypothetical protein